MKRYLRRPEIWGLALAAAIAAWIGWPDSNIAAPAAQAPETLGRTACTRIVGSIEAARDSVRAAAPGSIVCLRDGEFGRLSLNASKTRPGVTLRAEHPGKASLDGLSMDGKNLTAARFTITADVEIQPGSSGMTVEHNRIGGGYFGVEAGPTTTVTVNDVAIVGNRFVGPFGEDAIRLNRYHDGDGDGSGALVSGNEFTNIRENGSHSDCLQTVWYGDHLVYTRNYVHDNRCQGFFVKDQEREIVGITVVDNLFLRNNAPCPPEVAGDCGTPSDFQVFGPYRRFQMLHNTIWGNGANASFQEGTGPGSAIRDNVAFKFWTSTDLSSIRYEDNTRCQRQSSGGSWPRRTPGETIDCDPAFRAPARDDYRLASGRGVRWAPRDQHFGP